MKKIFFSFCFLSILALPAIAQDSVSLSMKADTVVHRPDSADRASLITISAAMHMPGGDLSKRFGASNSLGGGFYYKTGSNWLLGAEAHFNFGSKVKEKTILDSLRTGKNSEGQIIDMNGQYADVRLYERGYDFSIRVGKVFPVGRKMNRNSGFFATFGAGFLQHKIRIESIGNRSPQIDSEYRKGYDRLSNGLMLSQHIGFFYMGDRRLLNFYVALELNEGFTQGRRYNFDQNAYDDAKRTDLLMGIRLGWMIPVNSAPPDEFYYF